MSIFDDDYLKQLAYGGGNSLPESKTAPKASSKSQSGSIFDDEYLKQLAGAGRTKQTAASPLPNTKQQKQAENAARLDALAGRTGAQKDLPSSIGRPQMQSYTSQREGVTMQLPQIDQWNANAAMPAVKELAGKAVNMGTNILFPLKGMKQGVDLLTGKMQSTFGPEAERQALSQMGAVQRGVERVAGGLNSIVETPAAALRYAGETAVQAGKNLAENFQKDGYGDRLSEAVYRKIKNQLTETAFDPVLLKYVSVPIGTPPGKVHEAYLKLQEEKGAEQAASAALKEITTDTPVDPNSAGTQLMRQTQERQAAAVEGLSPTGQFIGNTLASVGQNAMLMPLAAINPAVPLAGMAGMAGAGKAYEVQQAGGGAMEALARGTVSGLIEAATEKLPLDNLLKIASSPVGKKAIWNILEQMGTEATEEAVSYVANYIADAAAKDPNAEFSLKDMMLSALGGGLSGGIMGAGGVVVGYARNGNVNSQAAQPAQESAFTRQAGTDANAAQSAAQADSAGDAVSSVSKGEAKATSAELIGKLRNSIPEISRMKPVAQITGNEFAKGQKSLVQQVGEFFRSLGNKVTRQGFGDVRLDERGVKDSMAHGIGRRKAAAFAAVPHVIQFGQEIDEQTNWKNRGYDTRVFAAPITVGGTETNYIAAVVTQGTDNRYYLHEVLDQDGNIIFSAKKEAGAVQTDLLPSSGSIGSPTSLDPTVPQTEPGVNTSIPNAGSENSKQPGLRSTNPDVQAMMDAQGRIRVSRRTQRVFDRLGEKLGVNIIVDAHGNGENGYYDSQTRTIHLNADSRDLLGQVFSHEITHRLKEASSADYLAFAQLAEEQLRRTGEYDSLASRIRDAYGELSPDALADEMVAHYAQNLVTSIDEFERLAGINRNLAQKLLDWLDEILHQARLSLQGLTVDEQNEIFRRYTFNEVAAAAKAWKEALRRADAGAQGSGEIRRMFVLASEQEAARGEALEQEGKPREDIWRETGLLRDAKGNWLTEIDDSGAQFRADGDARLLQEERYRRLQELTDKWEDGSLDDAETAEMDSLGDEYSDRVWEEKYELQDYLAHDKIYQEFPMLRHANVRFEKLPDGVNGYYRKRDFSIVLSRELFGKGKRTILHEIQHILQDMQKRPGGSSPEYWNRKMNEGLRIRENDLAISRADKEYRRLFDSAPEELKNKIRELNRAKLAKNYEAVLRLEDALYHDERYSDLFSAIDNADFERRTERGRELLPRELYRNTAGEIEARETSARADMTAEERRAEMPDLGWDRAVFAEDGESNYSYDDHLLLQFREWMNGRMPAKGYFEIGTTPKILQKHGAKPLPVIMETDTVLKFSAEYKNHAIAMEEAAKLPSQLEHPIMLFKGSVPNSFVVLTEIKDKSGNDVVAAVHLNKEHMRLKVNRIASIYGKDNVIGYVNRQISAGNLLDADAKKAPIWFTIRGLQLPKMVQTIIDANNSKAQDASAVNPHSMQEGKKYSRTLAPELAEEHGTIEPGEHPANDVLLPRKDGSGSPVRRTYRTAAESRHADERMQAEIEQVLRDGAASYQVSGDREAADYAGATLSREGFDGARGRWNAALESGKTNKNDIALGERLYVEAANRGDYQAAREILAQVAAEATIAGQKVQAIRLIKRMGPAGELLTLEQTVRKIQKEIEPKVKKLQKNSSEQIESLKKSVVELENELKPVEKKLEQAKQALDAARAERDWLKKRIKSYNNRNATTTNLANELEPKLGELWKQLAEAESSYQKAAEDYEVTREILKQAQKRLASVKNRTESLNRREYSDWWNIQAINEKTEAAKQRYREAVEQFEDTRQKRRALEEMKKRINQLEGKISIPQSVVDDILSQKTQKSLDEAMTRAYAEIGKQVPSNWADKWNAWRYMAMLVNPTTHIRNITGNLFFRPAIALKDAIKIPMERALMPRYKGDPTAAFLTGSQTDKGYLAQGRESFEENRRMLMSSGKYNPSNEIRDNMRIFQNGVLEAIRRKNGGALEAEDLVFMRRSYVRAYAQVLKANDYAAQDGARQAEIRKQAESWAAEEAWRATYRDASAAADAISRFSRINAATSVVTEGLLPFKKTPINVAKRGLSYSPAGLVKGLYDMTYGVKSGKVDAAHAIDQFASGLSGTAIVALGAYLASQGLLNGAGDDDDKARAYRKQVSGYQQYSLQIGDKSYTIDWLAPSSMPLFVGAELWKLKQGEAASFKDFYEAMKTLPSPMVEMSMLSSLEDAIDAASYGRSGGEKLVNVFGDAVGSYFGQAVPTLGGKINRIIDGTQRNAYYKDKTALVPSDWTVAYNSTIRQKVPGMSKGLEPKLDVWGREQKEGLGERIAENLVSPGYLSHNKETPVDKEILRLYEKTGESSVIPNTSPNKYFPAKNNLPRYDMSAAEYTAYMRVRGTTSYELINQMISSSAYKKMGDEEKAKMIGELYQYAGEIAKRRIAPEYANKSMDKAIEICTKANLTYGQYLTVRAQADTDGNGSVSQEEAKKAIDASGLSRKQKSAMWQSFNSKWKNNPYQ